MLSTLYESYKDNIEEPYKEEFRKTLFAPTGSTKGLTEGLTRESFTNKYVSSGMNSAQKHSSVVNLKSVTPKP